MFPHFSAYTINGTDGALTQTTGSPFASGATPVGISITPSGKFVYVANSGSNNVSSYSLGSGGGSLKSQGRHSWLEQNLPPWRSILTRNLFT